jgi:membrane-associated phospholipid phosphatase
MFDITLIRTWIGISLVWPLLWALVFNRWFFMSPLGLFIVFGIPIAGWVLWWKYYEGNGEKLLSEGRLVLDKGTKTLLKVKKQISKKRVPSQQ